MGILSRFMNMNQHSHDDLVREQKFFEFIGSYVCLTDSVASINESSVATDDDEELTICLLAHAPQAAVSRALAAHGAMFGKLGITVKAIFADVSDKDALYEFCAGFVPGSHDVKLQDRLRIRVIENAKLLDGHEQLILGEEKCWSGDVLRRAKSHSKPVELFVEDSVDDIRLARMAFSGMWAATKDRVLPENIPAIQPGESGEETLMMIENGVSRGASATYNRVDGMTRH